MWAYSSTDSLNKRLCKFQLWSYNQTLCNQKQLFLPAIIFLEFWPKLQLPVLTKFTLILRFVWTDMCYAPQPKAWSYFIILDTFQWSFWVVLQLLRWYGSHRSTRKHKITMIPMFTRDVWFAPDTTEFIQSPGCHRPVRSSRASQVTIQMPRITMTMCSHLAHYIF